MHAGERDRNTRFAKYLCAGVTDVSRGCVGLVTTCKLQLEQEVLLKLDSFINCSTVLFQVKVFIHFIVKA